MAVRQRNIGSIFAASQPMQESPPKSSAEEKIVGKREERQKIMREKEPIPEQW